MNQRIKREFGAYVHRRLEALAPVPKCRPPVVSRGDSFPLPVLVQQPERINRRHTRLGCTLDRSTGLWNAMDAYAYLTYKSMQSYRLHRGLRMVYGVQDD